MTAADPYLAFVGFYNDWSAAMEGDKEFYTKLALRASGPIVELGAGNGRVSIPIARAGKDVIAVDVSRAMIEDGARRAADAGVADRITWIEAPMQRFIAQPPVDLVIIPFRSFLHLETTEDQLRTLERINRSLTPGGRLALNIFVPNPHVIAGRDGERLHLDDFVDADGRRCEIWQEPRYETATQRIHLRAICEAYDGERLVETTEAMLELRMVYRYEMEHLLARAGFEIEALYGWFDERPFTEDSREIVWVARKP